MPDIDYRQFDSTQYNPADPGTLNRVPPAQEAKPSIAEQRIELQRQKEQQVDQPMIDRLRGMEAQYTALANQRTPVPRDPKFTEPPPAPKLDFTEPIRALQNPGVLIATLGSFFSRAPMTAAMNAGGAAMEAYHKGEAEVFAQKREEWKENLTVALEKNKIAMDKLQNEWRKSDVAVKDRLARMQAIASGEKMETVIGAIQGGHFEQLDKIFEGLQKAQDKADESVRVMDRMMNMADYRAKLSVKTAEEKQKIVHDFNAGVISEETLDFGAEQLIAGNTQFVTGLFRTPGAKLKFEERAVHNLMQRDGMTAQQAGQFVASQSNKFKGESAYQQSAGRMAANVESATNEVEQLIPQAIETSRALPRSRYVPVNEVIQKFQQGTSDPEYNDFVLANFSLMNAYARAMNPRGTPHVNDRLEAHAQKVLSIATSPEAYEKQIRRLWLEVQASKKAQAETRQGLGEPKSFPSDSAKQDWMKRAKEKNPDASDKELSDYYDKNKAGK